MTIYRQRNVFDRWRRRKDEHTRGGGVTGRRESADSPAYSQVATSATATPPGGCVGGRRRSDDADVEMAMTAANREQHITPSKGKVGVNGL